MKRILSVLLAMTLSMIALSAAATPVRKSLNGRWLFRNAASTDWYEALVPGQVHTDLMNNGLIGDPFYRANEKQIQWVSDKDWEYRREFTITENELKASDLELVMEGIDTYADVYVNNYKIEHCDNMFRTWRCNVKPFLEVGENTIEVKFSSVFKVDFPKFLAAPYKLQAYFNNDQNQTIWLSVYARKSGYNYGWDWGPRLITTGIWRDIYIESWDSLKVSDAQIITESIAEKGKDVAGMKAAVSITSGLDADAEIRVCLDGKRLGSRKISLHQGANEVSLYFSVKHPELWWTNGLGEQPLYKFDIEVSAGDHTATKEVVTGIRTVEIVREIDGEGQSMYVRLNGIPVFMKGANYIPQDNFPARVPDSKYEFTIRSAAEANMNMLRVWGGGFYEKDLFYDLCDRYGILVWQDMMFACGMFPGDRLYLDNVAAEVRDNVRRLRNHPCIALWNGNNENEIAYYGWGWRKRFTPKEDRIYQANLKKLFHQVIPEAIRDVDPSRYYHPTSPITGYNGKGMNMGDVHFWSVWKGGWVEEYLKPRNIGRFMSEYGFQAYPDMFTIRKYAREDEMRLDSEVILSHQRARDNNTGDPHFANNMLKRYMDRYYGVPEDFEEFIYLTQIQQADAVKVGIEAHRRAMPYCMGTLYWQINDCWPVASWSSIDYYNRWKALHYQARESYKEVIPSPYKESDLFKVKVVSDRLSKVEAELHVQTMTLEGEVLYQKDVPFEVKGTGAEDVFQIEEEELLCNRKTSECFVTVSIEEKGKIISSNIYYPCFSKEYDYPEEEINIKAEDTENGVVLNIKSDVLVRGLYMWTDEESFFENNYMTLVPGEDYRVNVRTAMSADEFMKKLEHLSLNNMKTLVK